METKTMHHKGDLKSEKHIEILERVTGKAYLRRQRLKKDLRK